MLVNDKECEAAGISAAEVGRVALAFDKAAKRARALGLFVFGGSGGGTLRFRDDPTRGALIVARLDEVQLYDGGDGGEMEDADGLERGE